MLFVISMLLSDWPMLMMLTVKESDNEDGGDAELNDGFDEVEENEAEDEEGNDDGHPENGDRAPINNTDHNGHESDHTAGHGDQEEDLAELSDLLDNGPRLPIRTSTSVLSITISDDEADEVDADGEPVAPIAPSSQVENIARRREASRDQSSSLGPLSREDNSASIEEQLIQQKHSILLEYERLKTLVKKANETAGNLIKRLREENEADAEKLKQVLLNENASEEDIKSALNGIGDKVINNRKKRKLEKDENDKMERVAVKLENSEFQKFFKNDYRQPEPALANTSRQRLS